MSTQALDCSHTLISWIVAGQMQKKACKMASYRRSEPGHRLTGSMRPAVMHPWLLLMLGLAELAPGNPLAGCKPSPLTREGGRRVRTRQGRTDMTACTWCAEVREQQMAAVLAVKACVQSAPYDIPPWLAPLLVGLLRAAKAPQPLRTVVRCCPLLCPDSGSLWGACLWAAATWPTGRQAC